MKIVFYSINKFILLPLVTLFGVSCVSINKSQYTKIVYRDLKNRPVFKLHLPKGFSMIRAHGSHASFYYFYYPDSTVIYIDGETSSGLNYDNIRKSGRFYDLFDKANSSDTLTVSGADSNGFSKNILFVFFLYFHLIPEIEALIPSKSIVEDL